MITSKTGIATAGFSIQLGIDGGLQHTGQGTHRVVLLLPAVASPATDAARRGPTSDREAEKSKEIMTANISPDEYRTKGERYHGTCLAVS